MKGGYSFRNFRGQPAAGVGTVATPSQITIPLKQGPGLGLEPLVQVGDTVEAGQIVARNDESLSSPIHASLAGTVTGIVSLTLDGADSRAVVIETDRGGRVSPQPVPGYTPDWSGLSADALQEILYLSGAASLGRDGVPTRFASAAIGPAEVEHVIITAISDDIIKPAADAVLPKDRTSDLAEGCRILHRVFPDATLEFAVTKADARLHQRIVDALATVEEVRIHEVSGKYPQSHEAVLVPTVLGKEFPSGFRAVNIGIVILDAAELLLISDAVLRGTPVIRRTVAVAGSGFTVPGYVDAPVGTPVSALLENRLSGGPARIVLDSLMNGPAVADVDRPITRTTKAVIAVPEADSIEMFSFAVPGFTKDSYSITFLSRIFPFAKETNTNIHGESRACISCSFCAEVCPAAIQPNLLHRYVEREMVSETLQRMRIFSCIDCNLCTYVCPSKIPLADLMKQGKQMLLDDGISDEGRIRDRFALKGLSE